MAVVLLFISTDLFEIAYKISFIKFIVLIFLCVDFEQSVKKMFIFYFYPW